MTNFKLWWSSSCKSQRNWWQQNISHWYWDHSQHSLSLRWLFVSFILIWKISDYIADYWCLWMTKKKKMMRKWNSDSSDVLIDNEIAAYAEFSFQWDSVNDLCAPAFKNYKHHNYFLSLQMKYNHHSHCCLRWCIELWDCIWTWKRTDCEKTVF